MFVDTHAHLCYAQFDGDRTQAIERALQAGVARIVDVGTNLTRSRSAVELARTQTCVSATVGIHPHEVVDAPEDLTDFEVLLSDPDVVAVGETGLDFYRDYAPQDLQERLFRAQIRLALDHDLPVVVHSRGAETRVLDLLEQEGEGRLRGVLHCFGGSMAEAQRAVHRGFYLGFGGTLTFRNSDRMSIVRGIPDDHLLLETDCPYLAPAPYRGKRNEPAYVRDIAEFLAETVRQPVDRIAETTTENAKKLFGLD